MRIKKIKKIEKSKTVYNLHIEKNNNYFANDLCVSNCHGTKALSLQKILKKCTKSEFRLGFTGTLPTEPSDIYNIFGYLGPKIFSMKSKELIDMGVLSPIKICNLILKYPKDMVDYLKNRDYQTEIETTLGYEPRNKALDFIFEKIPDKQNTLLLVNRIEKHLDDVVPYLKKKFPNKKVYTIHGKVDTLERERIRKLMEVEDNMIVVCTYQTMGQGVNIKKIHNVIFFASYKSKIKILQSLGRGLRKHKTKKEVILWDVVDDLTWEKRTGNIGMNHTYKHYLQRLEYYKDQKFKYINKNLEI